MTVMNFLGYSVNKMLLEQKEPVVQNKQTKIEVKQHFNVRYNVQDNKANVILSYNVDKDAPFKLDVELVGHFSFNVDEDAGNRGFNYYLQTNAVAIMFPYLRQVLTTLTALTNTMTPVILPTINIAELLKSTKQDQ